MIKKFNTFNEAKLADGDLLELVNNAFAYLVDENTNIVKISDQRTIKSEQVSVLIHPVISPSRKYTIEEYANELDRWNEIVQDTNVAAQQITDKGDISVLAHIEGYIRLTFYRTNNSNLFKVNPKSVYVSKVNFMKACGIPEEGCDFKIVYMGRHLHLHFDKYQDDDVLTKYQNDIAKVLDDNNFKYSLGTKSPFELKIYLEEPVLHSVRTGEKKKFILKEVI